MTKLSKEEIANLEVAKKKIIAIMNEPDQIYALVVGIAYKETMSTIVVGKENVSLVTLRELISAFFDADNRNGEEKCNPSKE
jgi:hypothetical protein